MPSPCFSVPAAAIYINEAGAWVVGQAWEGVRESARRSRETRGRVLERPEAAPALRAPLERRPRLGRRLGPPSALHGALQEAAGGFVVHACCAFDPLTRGAHLSRAHCALRAGCRGGDLRRGLSGPAAPGSVHVTHREALQVSAGSQVGCCAVLAELGRRRSGLWPERALDGEGGARLVRARFCFLVGTPRLPVCGSEDRRVVCLYGSFGKASALMEGRA